MNIFETEKWIKSIMPLHAVTQMTKVSIDYAIENDRGKVQEALTHYKTTLKELKSTSPQENFQTSRYFIG